MAQAGPLINGASATAVLGRLCKRALDTLLPPQCLGCRALVDEPGTLCSVCWGEITFLGPPQCHVCGLPFEYDLGEGALCGACARRAPVYRRARSALAYDQASRGLVIAFKHADRTDAAPAYGRWLARAGRGLIAESDLIAPVPLHWTRLFARRYNQAALLAQVLGRLSGLPVATDLLVRRRRTPSQGGLSPYRRRRNVQGAFAVDPKRRLEGRRVLLVDDVFTTGATAAACCRALLKAGAGSVDVLTLARVQRPVS